jgi:deoxycytidine triphosphate deaminase
VLEVRSHEVPFILEKGQIIRRLIYEPLTETPDVAMARASAPITGARA